MHGHAGPDPQSRAYKDIKISSLLTLLFEAVSVACILSLGAVILFKHGFPSDTAQLKAHGMTLHDLSLAVVVIASLLITGAFMVVMSYVEVYGAAHTGQNLANLSAPLTFLSKAYGVSFFKVPVVIGAMISFFSLTLSCLNAGSRIIFAMAHHDVFPKALGRSHPINETPYVAITTFIALILAVPCVLEIFTKPLTIFDDGGTLAAFGFLTADYLITIAAAVYLKKRGELKTRNVVLCVVACVALAVPTVGSFYPVPPFPVDIFPYIFLSWMLIGAVWLLQLSREQSHMFAEIEADLEATMAASSRSHDEDMGRVVVDVRPPMAPTFDELESAMLAAN